MSCNQDFFIQQEKNIRELYVKDILEGEYENVDFWVYTASEDEKYHVNKRQHKLYIPCNDSLEGTYDKTYKAFKLIEKLGLEYDYILRTNLSTYINVKVLSNFINSDLIDDKHIYCGSVYCAKNATGPYEFCYYGCGNALLLSKFWVNVITHNHVSKYRYNNFVFNPDEPYYKIDDNTIGLVINSYALYNEMDMFDIWRNFKWQEPGSIPTDANNYMAISFREYNQEGTRDNEHRWGLAIHMGVKMNDNLINAEQLLENQEVHILDFEKGMHSLVSREFADKFIEVMSLPKYVEKLKINNKKFNLMK